MPIKLKMILLFPLTLFLNWRARRISKKIKKPEGEERYPIQWRNDYVLKRAKLFLKIYNVKIIVKGFENIPKAPAIIIPNYNSTIDPVVIFCALENPDDTPEDVNYMPIFLIKKNCLKKRSIKGYMSILDTHFINAKDLKETTKNVENMDKAAKKNKKYQVIFLEENYATNQKNTKLQNLTFKNTKTSFLPIVPVTINNSLNLEKTSRKKTQKVEVFFHPVIKPMSIISHEIKDIIHKVKKIIETKKVAK